MSSEMPHYELPSLGEILLAYLVFSSVFLLIMPMPSFVLEFFIGWNWVFSIVVLMMGLYSCKLSSVSTLPALIICSSFNRLAIGTQIIWKALTFKDWWPELHLSFIELFLTGNLFIGGVRASALIITTQLIVLAVFWFAGKRNTKQHPSKGIQLALALMGLELLIGLIIVILIGIFHVDLQQQVIQLSVTAITLMKTGFSLNKGASLLLYMLNLEALFQAIPILLQTIGVALMLVHPEQEQKSLARIATLEIMQYPYALFFASVLILILAIAGIYCGAQWWALLAFSCSLFIIAFSIFLAADVQRQLADKSKASVLREKRQEILQKIKSFFHRT